MNEKEVEVFHYVPMSSIKIRVICRREKKKKELLKSNCTLKIFALEWNNKKNFGEVSIIRVIILT